MRMTASREQTRQRIEAAKMVGREFDGAAASAPAEAIRYALVRWEALCRFFDDGTIEMTTTPPSAQSAPLDLGEKTGCLPAPTRAVNVPPPSCR